MCHAKSYKTYEDDHVQLAEENRFFFFFFVVALAFACKVLILSKSIKEGGSLVKEHLCF